MAAFSTIDALNTLCTSVPDWTERLITLNSQIACRQIELARLEEGRERQEPFRPRSLRNKGSTESLRPRDGNVDPFTVGKMGQSESEPKIISSTPIHDIFTEQSPTRAAAPSPAVSPTADSNPIPKMLSGVELRQQASHAAPLANSRLVSAVLRKRKTDSLASAEPVGPKYRTRSMIIVYYDSAVQTAFEELVKFVSASRNAVRKGKMAAKMGEMLRAAELELDADDNDDEDSPTTATAAEGVPLQAQKRASLGKAGDTLALGDPDNSDTGDFSISKLRYASTRKMGPLRDRNRAETHGTMLSVGSLRGYRRSGSDANLPDIFDNLDKGLEWSQSQCERAAHQFLRDGDCGQEIESIKNKLLEVKETAEKELERLKKEEAEAPSTPARKAASDRAREMKPMQMRKEPPPIKNLEVDLEVDMEVDEDEGFDDIEHPVLVFKRSRNFGTYE